jgi:hypothetical protein
MFENLVVSAWVGVRASASMSYCVNTRDDIDLMLDDGARRFEFAIETEALRKLLEVGGRALAELDALADKAAAEAGATERAPEQCT